ncbi:MAG: SpoIIE family protein phosphatase [Chlamydiales bacterium]
MKDSKITKKRHPTGSMARRILVICLLLLVMPLFLQSLFLYRQEYRQKLNDVQNDLHLLAEERALLIEQSPSLPFEEFGRDLPSAYPVRIALFNSDRKLLWENRKLSGPALKASKTLTHPPLTLELSLEISRVEGLHKTSYYFRFGTLLFFVGILGGGAVYLFARRMARPLRSLCKAMERVSEGAAHVRYTPDWMGFEINALGVQFNETLDALQRNVQEAERERLARERLSSELRIGHEIQASLFPIRVPGAPGLDIAAGCFSSKEVNGDFYDLFRLENGRILIAICDTAGKGISACLFSLGLRSMIRALGSVTEDLGELVRRANDLYWTDVHESSMFSTLWIGIYDPKSRNLVYCSQGHPPALLVRATEQKELWTEGIALGAQKTDVVRLKEISLEKGDTLVLYTDGIIEAHNPKRELFGKKRLYELLARKTGGTAQQRVDQTIENVRLFSQGAPQHDDMTLLIFHLSD